MIDPPYRTDPFVNIVDFSATKKPREPTKPTKPDIDNPEPDYSGLWGIFPASWFINESVGHIYFNNLNNYYLAFIAEHQEISNQSDFILTFDGYTITESPIFGPWCIWLHYVQYTYKGPKDAFGHPVGPGSAFPGTRHFDRQPPYYSDLSELS